MTEEEKKKQAEAEAAAAVAETNAASADASAAEAEEAAQAAEEATELPAADAEGTGAEDPAGRPNYDAMRNRFQEAYPDDDLTDDEALYGKVNSRLDELHAENDGYKERESKFGEFFTGDPRNSYLLKQWKEGNGLIANAAQLYYDEFKAYMDDPSEENLQALKQAEMDHLKEMKEAAENEKAYEENLKMSREACQQKREEYGLSQEEFDQIMEEYEKRAVDIVMGIYTPETIDFVMKGRNYDKDIEKAAADAEVKGRVANIREKKRESKGSGLPMGSGGGSRNEKKQELNDDFLRRMKNQEQFWG